MKVVTDIREMIFFAEQYRRQGRTIGFVPTMGALHKGHLTLLAAARKLCDVAVMSIFVNPTQFGAQEDFSVYPRPFEQDCRLASDAGCDVLFAPLKEDLYPEYFRTSITVDGLSDILCGKTRPGHFRGVATIVCKLFNIVRPDKAVFGQKDAQQVSVLKRMVADLNIPVGIIVAPIVREADGLALSSRNRYLSDAERTDAAFIYKGLQRAEDRFNQGERRSAVLKKLIEDVYKQVGGFTVEYIEITDTFNLQPLEQIQESALLAVACRTVITKTRLIDNVVLGGAL